MPKKISFEKIGEKYVYNTKPNVNLKNYLSSISLPIAIGREVQNKNIRVTIEVIDDENI